MLAAIEAYLEKEKLAATMAAIEAYLEKESRIRHVRESSASTKWRSAFRRMGVPLQYRWGTPWLNRF